MSFSIPVFFSKLGQNWENWDKIFKKGHNGVLIFIKKGHNGVLIFAKGHNGVHLNPGFIPVTKKKLG